MRRIIAVWLSLLMVSGSVFFIFDIQEVKGVPITITVPVDYPTIQQAIDNASAGDTIRVWNGTYPESIYINKPLSLIGNSSLDTIIDPSGTGNVVSILSNWVNMSFFKIFGTPNPDCGISLISSNYCNISYCNIFAEGYGITLDSLSNYNDVIYNYCAGPSPTPGPDNILIGGDHNNISHNICLSSWDGVYTGVFSEYNVISYNTFNGNRNGVVPAGNNNLFQYNNVTNNTYGFFVGGGPGIYLSTIKNNNINNNSFAFSIASSQAKIYNNNIFFNGVDSADSGTNSYNEIYPIGGNYWDTYSGIDMFSGPNQDQPGSDGIGDTPHLLPIVQDDYPFMQPFNFGSQVPPDISLISPSNNSIVKSGTVLYFEISDSNHDLQAANYSVDGGADQSFLINYQIDMTGWPATTYSIEVHAIDMAGNTGIEIYGFTIDPPPIITLNSPVNNSIITAGTFLDLDVIDTNLYEVNYSVNGGTNTSFPSPYNVSTIGWIDGSHVIEVHANDTVNNSVSRSYDFIIDSTSPEIILNSPANNTIILPGTIIDIDVIDDNINAVNYSLNGGSNQSLVPSYDIDTTGWVYGTYIVEVHAIDDAGNTAVKIYGFTINSADPEIVLNSPANDTIVLPGTIIDIDVIDDNINAVNYSLNGGSNQSLDPTYDIDTTGWSDGTYIVEVHAIDDTGNTALKIYEFMIDTTPPIVDAGTDAIANDQYMQNATSNDVTSGIDSYLWTQESGPGTMAFGTPNTQDTYLSADTDGTYIIRLTAADIAGNTAYDEFELIWDATSPNMIVNTPMNNSVINDSVTLDFVITDPHLDTVSYAINGNPFIVLSSPFDINTAGWTDGVYNIDIAANDTIGNNLTRSYTFNMDSTGPVIISTIPAHGSEEIVLNTTIQITFNEDMDTISVENALLFDPFINVSNYQWLNDTALIIILSEDLSYNTTYTITLGTNATDHNGNYLDPEYSFSFTTILDTVDEIPDDNIGDYWWILLLMAVIIILSLLFFKRKKPEAVSEPETD